MSVSLSKAAFVEEGYEEDLKRPIRNVVNVQLPWTYSTQVIVTVSHGFIVAAERRHSHRQQSSKAAFMMDVYKRDADGANLQRP